MGSGLADLEWLMGWFESRCDGSWEHKECLRLEAIDNPGWWITIDIAKERVDASKDTVLAVEGEPPSARNGNVGGPSWMLCQIKAGKFEGAGDSRKLARIIGCFREMVMGENGAGRGAGG